MSSCSSWGNSYGVCQLNHWIGVWLYKCITWEVTNSQYEGGRYASCCIESALSIRVYINLSTLPFYWGVCRVLWKTWIPLSTSNQSNAPDLYSPPTLDIHPFTKVLYWFFTICKKSLVACNVEFLLCIITVQAKEVKSSKKTIMYQYFWYDPFRKEFKSKWINLKGNDACFVLSGKDSFSIFQSVHLRHGVIDFVGLISGKLWVCFCALDRASEEGCPNHLCIISVSIVVMVALVLVMHDTQILYIVS